MLLLQGCCVDSTLFLSPQLQQHAVASGFDNAAGKAASLDIPEQGRGCQHQYIGKGHPVYISGRYGRKPLYYRFEVFCRYGDATFRRGTTAP